MFVKTVASHETLNFTNDEDIKKAVTSWLQSLAVTEYITRIEKLVSRYNKYLNSNGNYVEM